MKKILFVRKSNPQVGGVEMQMLRIAIWLRDHRGIQASLATDNINSALAKLFAEKKFTVYECRLEGSFYIFSAVRTLLGIIRENKITCIQAHMFRESVVCRFVKLFMPRAIHVFRIETYIDCSSISNFKKSLYHRLAYLTRNLVNHYVANGNLVADELAGRSGVRRDKIRVVFNGVEPFGIPDYEPLLKDETGFLQAAMVANFVRGKGHELLFETIALLRKNNIHYKVFLFGDDMGDVNSRGQTYRQELTELAVKLGIENRIVFAGFSSNLSADIKSFRIILLPSFSEGTPNTILEAMSAGKLVIASNAGELGYMIQDGITGMVHEIGDMNGLYAILHKVYMADPAAFENMRRAGYQRWLSLFSLEGMMNELSEVYKN